MLGQAAQSSDLMVPLPPRLVTDDDLKNFYEAMKIYEVPKDAVVSSGVKRKSGHVGGLDTQHYGRGKRAREVCLLCEFLVLPEQFHCTCKPLMCST